MATVDVTYRGFSGTYMQPPEPAEGIADVEHDDVPCGFTGEVDAYTWDSVTWSFDCPTCGEEHDVTYDVD